ncbi:hypothetical protein Tco_0004855 [Tanacetum coccineum]
MEDKKMVKQSMDSSYEKLWYLADEDDEEETYVFDMNEFPAIQIHNNLSSKLAGTHESLYSTHNEKYDATTCDFSLALEFLQASKSHTVGPVYSLDTFKEEYKDSYFPCVKQSHADLENGNLDIYEPRQCYDEYERTVAEAIILIDNRLNRAGITNNNAIQANQEWFDDHEPMEYDDDDDDDDIGDLDDYLIPKDSPYYVDEEEEGFKERRRKLLGIPYKKPPMFKSKKFEVVKYSFGPAEEYVAIREYEYDIWVRTKENVSNVYQEIFDKKDEGWFQYGVSITMDTAYRIDYPVQEVLNANEENGGMHIIWNLMCVVHAGIQTLFTRQHT